MKKIAVTGRRVQNLHTRGLFLDDPPCRLPPKKAPSVCRFRSTLVLPPKYPPTGQKGSERFFKSSVNPGSLNPGFGVLYGGTNKIVTVLNSNKLDVLPGSCNTVGPRHPLLLKVRKIPGPPPTKKSYLWASGWPIFRCRHKDPALAQAGREGLSKIRHTVLVDLEPLFDTCRG